MARHCSELYSASPPSHGEKLLWATRRLTSLAVAGKCGSCWAFSTTEGVESAVFRSSGKLPPPLSTEQLVDCEKADLGCNGGDIPEAIRYLKQKGMATAADYHDESSKSGRTEKCTWDGEYAVDVQGFKYAIPTCTKGNCAHQNEHFLAAALAKHGPLSVCINSGDGQPGDWDDYKSGVWKRECKAKAALVDHCVQLVGYDKSGEEPYWKLRNCAPCPRSTHAQPGSRAWTRGG